MIGCTPACRIDDENSIPPNRLLVSVIATAGIACSVHSFERSLMRIAPSDSVGRVHPQVDEVAVLHPHRSPSFFFTTITECGRPVI